jgi:MFS family permease
MQFLLASGMLTPLIIATALFMENMDATVISTSLPAIAQDLLVDPVALKLALTSYLVSLAVFIPSVAGWQTVSAHDGFSAQPSWFSWRVPSFAASVARWSHLSWHASCRAWAGR